MAHTDAALIGMVRSGETDAFTLLFERYQERCVRLAQRLLADADEAEDAVQDAFIRAYLSLDSYKERERFGSWLLCIVANRCRTASMKARRRSIIAAEWWSERRDGRDSAEPDETDHALARQLQRAMSTLPPETRSAVLDKYGRDLTYTEIAAATGAEVSALKMRVARGSAQLRRALVGAGVTLTVALVIASIGSSRKTEPRASTSIACDTLRALMRDTLNPATADSMMRAGRCSPDDFAARSRGSLEATEENRR